MPAGTRTVQFDGATYYCLPKPLQHVDCYPAADGAPDESAPPTLYCSGVVLQCSRLWYPDILAEYTLTSLDGGSYICAPARIADLNCASYRGGDPAVALIGMTLKCSRVNSGLTCRTDYYPSDLAGLQIIRVSLQQYVCKTNSLYPWPCYPWSGYGSPKDATYGLPTLYCTSDGVCKSQG